jgi:hypothetical protein
MKFWYLVILWFFYFGRLKLFVSMIEHLFASLTTHFLREKNEKNLKEEMLLDSFQQLALSKNFSVDNVNLPLPNQIFSIFLKTTSVVSVGLVLALLEI